MDRKAALQYEQPSGLQICRITGKVTGGIKMNASSGMGMVGAIVWMVVLFGIMYFLMLRPQKKEQKRLQAMLNDMEVGDSIVTTKT